MCHCRIYISEMEATLHVRRQSIMECQQSVRFYQLRSPLFPFKTRTTKNAYLVCDSLLMNTEPPNIVLLDWKRVLQRVCDSTENNRFICTRYTVCHSGFWPFFRIIQLTFERNNRNHCQQTCRFPSRGTTFRQAITIKRSSKQSKQN